MRLAGIHMINAPSLANQLMMFLKPLMHKDLYSLVRFRIFLKTKNYIREMSKYFVYVQINIHPSSDMDRVYKSIPKEYFASDLGGKSPSLETLNGKYR